jgi:hypothetical protein
MRPIVAFEGNSVRIPLLALVGRAHTAPGFPMFGAKRPRRKAIGSSAHDPKQPSEGAGATDGGLFM